MRQPSTRTATTPTRAMASSFERSSDDQSMTRRSRISGSSVQALGTGSGGAMTAAGVRPPPHEITAHRPSGTQLSHFFMGRLRTFDTRHGEPLDRTAHLGASVARPTAPARSAASVPRRVRRVAGASAAPRVWPTAGGLLPARPCRSVPDLPASRRGRRWRRHARACSGGPSPCSRRSGDRRAPRPPPRAWRLRS